MIGRCTDSHSVQETGYGYTHLLWARGGSCKPHCPWKGPYTVIKKFLMSHTELETTNKKR